MNHSTFVLKSSKSEPSSCEHSASLDAGAGVECGGGCFPALGQTPPVCTDV